MNIKNGFGNIITLFKNYNFSLLFFGRFVSNTGSAIFFISVVWIAAAKIGGVKSVSTILIANAIPLVILTPFGGVLADRWNRRNILVLTDLISGITMISLALLFNFKNLQIEFLFVTVFIIQLCSSIFNPTLQAMVPNIVEENNLSQANSLIETINNLTQIIGLGIGGFLVSIFGFKYVLIIDGISFLFSAITEMFIKVEPSSNINESKLKATFFLYLKEIKTGIDIVLSKVELKGLIILETLIDFLGVSLFIFLPIFASRNLNIGSQGYGIMQAFISIGSLMGALILSFIPEIKNKYKSLTISVFFTGFSILLMGKINNYNLMLLTLLFLGLFLAFANIVQVFILQKNSPDNMRGKVFSLRASSNQLLRPISYGLIGIIGTLISPSVVIMIVGGIIMFLSFFYLLINRNIKMNKRINNN